MNIVSHTPFKCKGVHEVSRWVPASAEYRVDIVPEVVDMLNGAGVYREVRVSAPREGFPWGVQEITFEVLDQVMVAEIHSLQELFMVLQENPGFCLRWEANELRLEERTDGACL